MAKKNMNYSNKELRSLVEITNKEISIARQCSLINIPRSSYYYKPREMPLEQIEIMHKIDRIYTKYPFYGSPRITEALRRLGTIVNHKRVERLMRLMGITAIMPKRNISKRNKEHLIYPYLLRGVEITSNNHVWSTDITYYPDKQQFCLSSCGY